ncbi:uncharacterized protein LOC142899687 isoform X5 [Nelusetta ayraudi]|uniref:uncharacterized protein LOC142899687 isoform X5 n=1 Tax=Nelusetta ayraudi TaxID=303726 RepID=UPI003F711B14
MAGMYGCFRSRNSEGAAMASGSSEVTATQEPAEAAEECSGFGPQTLQAEKVGREALAVSISPELLAGNEGAQAAIIISHTHTHTLQTHYLTQMESTYPADMKTELQVLQAGGSGEHESRFQIRSDWSGRTNILSEPEQTLLVRNTRLTSPFWCLCRRGRGGKKKSKFQTFKKFFARKKRKEPPAATGADSALKGSQSSDNVSKTSESNALTRAEQEKGSGSKVSLGSKALSHDSVFVSDSSEANEALGASQDSIHGKVKSLQMQLKQAIKLGSPPSLMCVKRTEDGGAVSEDDGLPCSPPEYAAARHAAAAQRSSGVSLEGADSDDEQSCGPSSRAVSPLVVVPGDFSQPASPFACLDNSAAKHKRGLRSKACHRRKPISKLEMKAERDSVEETTLDSSAAEAPQERQETAEGVKDHEPKPQVEADGKEDNKEEADEEEFKKTLGDSLLRDDEEEEEEVEEEEEEEEVNPGQEASPATDTSCPQPRLSEDVPPASPGSSSRPSSADSPRVTPEPPAGPRGAWLGSSSVGPAAAAVEVEEEEQMEEEKEEEEEKDAGEAEEKEKPDRGEETSFLQEVLSSLKTPLESRSLGVESEDVVLEVKEEVEAREAMGAEEENQEVMEEDEEAEEPVNYQAAPDSCPLSSQTAEKEEKEEKEEEEEEEEVNTLSTRAPEEEENVKVEEEEPVAEHSSQCDLTEDGETKETNQPEEESDVLAVNAEVQLENKKRAAEEEESYGEEVTEVEKEPAEEVDDDEEEEEGGASEEEEAKEATEREEEEDEEKDGEEEMMEEPPPSAAAAPAPAPAPAPRADGKEIETSTAQLEEDEVGGLSSEHLSADNGAASAEPANQEPDPLGEVSSRSFEEEEVEVEVEEEQEEQEKTGVIEERVEEQLVREEEGGADRAGEEEKEEEEVEQEELVEKCDTKLSDVPIRPPSLTLLESNQELPSEVGGATSPSKTRTATLQINLISPSADKGGAFFQQSPTAAHPTETEEQAEIAGGGGGGGGEGEGGEGGGEEEKQAEVEEERPAGSDEAAEQLISRPAQSKVRFTIAPAWQRSLSAEGEAKEGLTPPDGVEEEVKEEVVATIQHDVNTESEGGANVEPEGAVPGGPAGGVMSQPPPTKAPPPVTAATEATDPSVVVEGNPDNPFGVKLRKTSVLQRFSSEEESGEPLVKSPAAPATSSKVESPQPISAKPSVSQPIVSKPALPKKPDLQGDAAGKSKRVSDPPAVRCAPAGSESPSWISVAKQKQKIYKENSLEEATNKKEEQEKKSSVPSYVASAASREKSKETAESSSKVIQPEASRPPEAAEESRRPLSPLAPLPYHPPKSLPCPVPPKPSQLSAARPPLTSAQRFPPTAAPVGQKSPPCASPSSLPKPAVSPRTPASPPQLPSPRGAGLPPSQTPSSQRGLPSPPTAALPQDEPPWMALAKKKAKAWSEMPQIVQ